MLHAGMKAYSRRLDVHQETGSSTIIEGHDHCDGDGSAVMLCLGHPSLERHATVHIIKLFPARPMVEVIREKVADAHTAQIASFEQDFTES
ncbi:hypothetical protein ARMSODRAFT_1088437 [Armillaria solidipes]|uniref:Uncharacterized protein n=1 Tax=Armillaria solidipes TaxID=1076256 RepID=A0A2H3B9D7_9AGAR|nr:hypothetical protein ARMSODRAFT_1088437 [Armillaria solidipes]